MYICLFVFSMYGSRALVKTYKRRILIYVFKKVLFLTTKTLQQILLSIAAMIVIMPTIRHQCRDELCNIGPTYYIFKCPDLNTA